MIIDKKKLEALRKRFKGKGQVRNFSSKTLWVIESDSNDQNGPATAHKLLPGSKSPPKFDADGFKRTDGGPINGHKSWWKIWGYGRADIFDRGQGLTVDALIKFKVPENEFGPVEFDPKETWGIPIRQIAAIKRALDGSIVRYFVEELGWISRKKAFFMAAKGELDDVVLVLPRKGEPYLRTVPDGKSENNFGNLA